MQQTTFENIMDKNKMLSLFYQGNLILKLGNSFIHVRSFEIGELGPNIRPTKTGLTVDTSDVTFGIG